MKFIIGIIALLFISACGSVPWNKQQYAGLNSVHFSWCKAEEGSTYLPCKVRIIDGKEQGSIDFKFQMPDGTILNFTADNVKAFEGQALRAEVEKAVAEQIGEVSPGLVDAILSAVTGVK